MTTFLLAVGSPPAFKTKPAALTVVKKGTSKELLCSADGKPTPSYEWRKEDDTTPLKNDSSYTVYPSGSLLIKSMDKGKAGKYKCTAKNVFNSPTVEGVVKQACEYIWVFGNRSRFCIWYVYRLPYLKELYEISTPFFVRQWPMSDILINNRLLVRTLIWPLFFNLRAMHFNSGLV